MARSVVLVASAGVRLPSAFVFFGVAVGAVLLLAAAPAPADAQCTVADPDNAGHVYDISPLTNDNADYAGSYSANANYKMQFCRTLVQNVAGCPNSLTMVCETYQSSVNSVGNQPTSLKVMAPGQLQLVYAKGNSFSAVANLYCDPSYPSATAPYIAVTSDLNGFGPGTSAPGSPITISVRSTFACSSAGPVVPPSGDGAGGLSGGDVFLLIFFLGGALYVGVGMLYNYKRHNAQGWDMVPNIAFWRELPSLIKDGFRYVFLGLKDCCGK